ncbi:hypothetical protein TEQG_08742 [Trichophyton equinum CBS 127.97]|uniref:Uncharacterized protein n=1 Tax=Trichophyton equinum (strain ATCC MYA-4606 / CBS 127.97) TaxID=559882 RepID=F2PY91_TRIEC|nr:hypothetical protein TEQG_08742 [Trichophyton equinum CBS 127.97]
MSCSIKNHDTCLPITALKHVNIPGRRLLLNGSGPFVQLLDKSTGTLLDRFRVFERNTVHGIQAVEECWRDDDDYTSSFLVWGGYSLRIVKLHLQGSRETENVSLLAGSGECRTPDWILDTTVPSTSSENKRALKGLLITAHNVVFTLTFLLHETELGDENIIQLHELGSNLRPILYSADITWSSNRVLVAAGTVFGEIIIWSCQLALDSDPCQQADDSIAINHLFTGHEGSIFGVDISPDIPINGGHATKKFVASCSDDRTIRIWDISSYDQGLTSNGELSACETSTNSRGTGFHITPADETSAAQEFCLAKEYGHEARIWGIRFLDFEVSDGSITFNLISRSEDCTSVVWKLTTKYELVNDKYILRRDQTILKPISSYSYHVGKNIWSMDVVENMGSFGVLTGGADSNISSLIVPHTGENIPGRRAKTYTHDRVYDEFLRINNHPAVSDERTKNSRNDGKINSFGFISEDSFIAPFTEGVALLGQVSTAEPQDIRSQDGGVLRWSTIPTIGGIGSYVAIAGIPEREIGLIGTSTGRILWYSHKEGRVEELADISRGISDIFVIQPPKGHDGNDTCPVTFITSSRAFSHANLFIVETSPSPKVLSNQQLALPAEFVVSSALSIPSMSLLILGARWGNIVVFRFSPELQREAPEDPLCVFPTHKKDAVTSITFLREDQNSSFVDLITTGRDGTYCIHRLDRSGIQFKMETLHRISPSFGPYIEGSRLDPKTGHLILWGFRSTYFVLWDETTQTEILSVECGGAHRRWAYHFGNMGHVLLWIKASTFNIMSEQFQCHRRVRQGGHGREVKAMSISKMQVDGAKTPWTVLATGAEDTEIRFFTLNEGAEGKDGFRSIRAIKKHSAEGGEFTLLAQGVYTSNCLTQIRLVMSGSELQLITGSTDGHIAVWDLTPSIKPYFDLGGRSIKRRDAVPFPAEPVSIKWGDRRPAHQNSIKAMELLPLSGAQVLLITGGDDNCLAFSILRFSEPSTSGPRPSLISRLSTASYPDAHASAINAISQVRRIEHGEDKRMVEFLVASSGNDQRIKLWSALADCIDGDVQVSLQGDVYTAVADLSAVDQFTVKASGQDREHLVLCGVGMEMWEVCT